MTDSTDPFYGTSIAFLEHNERDVMIQNNKPIITISANNPEITYLMMVFANWCRPCQATKPEFAELSRVLDKLNLTKYRLLAINVSGEKVLPTEENWPTLAKEWFGVTGYPTLLLVKNGVVVDNHKGPRTVTGFINTLIGINDPTCPQRAKLESYKKQNQ
jgi:thiol-disulfide isomerase/thioredoxin